jgi:pimeloyl-ACP methyl ester carboxylesterase
MRLTKPIIMMLILLTGCQWMPNPFKNSKPTPTYWERYGKVYYLDGAGNLGFGKNTVPKALKSSGFRGDVENITWTSYTGPLGDQMIRINARYRSEQMTQRIIDYRRRYPDKPIYIIGLSAGTGVGVWAVEQLPEGMRVDSMVLLGSSLSTNYDLTKCLKHVKNKVYVLSSPNDTILKTFIPVTGTIDGSYMVQPAGLAGMYPPDNLSQEELDLYKEKVVNVPWHPTFARLDNDGGHTAATRYRFLKYFIIPRLLGIQRD